MVDLRRDAQHKDLLSKTKQDAIAERFLDLVCVMERLRKECPWDRKQTPESLKRYVLEETYEVLEAIEAEDWKGLEDELGDFMLQAVFQAKIQSETNTFDIESVLEGIVSKMVRRHPHVFADTTASNASEVEQNWEAIKRAEKGDQNQPSSALAGITRGLPALLESYKITRKAAKVGFDWPRWQEVLEKVEEELNETREAAQQEDLVKIQEELGDLLFATANLVRHFGLEPEETLRLGNRKFVKRFQKMEALAAQDGRVFAELKLDEQEALWLRAKKLLQG